MRAPVLYTRARTHPAPIKDLNYSRARASKDNIYFVIMRVFIFYYPIFLKAVRAGSPLDRGEEAKTTGGQIVFGGARGAAVSEAAGKGG